MATSSQVISRGRSSSAADRVREASRRWRPSPEAGCVWLAVLLFVAVSAWWFTQDDRIPIWDVGSHLDTAWIYGTALQHGHYLEWFTSYTTYPPLVHLVGALAYLVAGMHPMAMEMLSNIVFVPVLAFGCFGVGRELAGPRAGLLAAVFGLGTPMFVSMMHGFYIDPPQAAMVSVTMWALLASRRFSRFGISVVAGLLFGVAMMTKQTSLVFLVGPTTVIVLRGGWRRPGLAGFLICALGVALPWYVYHWSELTGTLNMVAAPNTAAVDSVRFSLQSFAWYFWDLVNEQAMLPFTLFFAVGLGFAVRRLWKGRLPNEATGIRRLWRPRFAAEEVLPELLVGAVVAYLAITYLTLKDPRYSLPGLVYVSTLATFWIPGLRRRRLAVGIAAAFVVVAAFNFAGMSFGIGGSAARVLVTIPGAPTDSTNYLYPGQLTLYEDEGWLRGPPAQDGNVLALLHGLHRLGITEIAIDPQDDGEDFSMDGINPLAPTAGLVMASAPLNAPGTAYLFLHTPTRGGLAPCQRMVGDNGVYIVEGNVANLDPATLRDPADRRQRYEFICPGRAPQMWPRG